MNGNLAATKEDELLDAIRERNATRERWQRAKTKREKREASEDLDFWQGKVANLEAFLKTKRKEG